MRTTFNDFKNYFFVSERNKDDLGAFKVGDIVYCIDDDNTSYGDLIKDSRYEITGMFKNTGGGQSNWLYNIKPLDTDIYQREFLISGFFEDRFLSELEYKASKYNI